jgi:NADH-quinone oxidoreductase subunit N
MPISPLPDLFPALPEIFLIVAAMGLLLVGVWHVEPDSGGRAVSARLISRLGLLSLAVAVVLVLVVAGRAPLLSFGGMFVVDEFVVFFKVLVLIAAAASLFIARDYLELHNTSRFEFTVLMMFASVGMLMMISANDFLALYMGLELQSLCLYVLAAFQRDDVRSSEAGLKYFVLSALASGLLLYGISLVYGFAGATNFDALAVAFEQYAGEGPPVGLITGIVFILSGLVFKVSAVPFHMWTPDVYDGAPTPTTAFFAVGPKLAAVALLLRVMMGPFEGLADQWQQIIVLISIGSMVIGALGAIGQSNIKRLMAYSSIGNIGYALIGLATGTGAGISSVMIYMAIYLATTLGAFTCILSMRRRDKMVVGIADLAGLSKTHPAMALAMAIFMFSLAGIPPLAGFFAKVYVFFAAIDAGLWALAIIGVLTSVVAAFYYLRIVKIMYFDEVTQSLDRYIGRNVGAVMAATGIIVLLFFVYPEPLLAAAADAAESLFPR